MPRRFLLILVSVVLCVGFMPLLAFGGENDALSVGALATQGLTIQDLKTPGLTLQADESHVPQNVRVKLTGTETDSNGQKWLVTEVSWDGDSLVSYNELYPFIKDANNGLWILPTPHGQTIVKDTVEGEDIPDDVRYTSSGGRNQFKLKIPILGPGVQQLFNEDGHKTNGL